jgi:hypothetical protein
MSSLSLGCRGSISLSRYSIVDLSSSLVYTHTHAPTRADTYFNSCPGLHSFPDRGRVRKSRKPHSTFFEIQNEQNDTHSQPRPKMTRGLNCNIPNMDLSVRASEQRRVNQPLDVTFQNEITGTMTRYQRTTGLVDFYY